jgi:Uma2 family endonuclease
MGQQEGKIMAVMAADVPDLPRWPPSGEWSVAHLSALPDQGMRYELLDGVLVVTPAPFVRHQMASTGLTSVLHAGCPAELSVLAAPTAYEPDDRNSIQPDLMVVRSSDINLDGPFTAVPLVVVEILAPGTRHKDLVTKHVLYQSLGITAYWIVDPAVPSIRVHNLIDGCYELAVEVTGDEEVDLEWPYPVRLCADELTAG